MATILVVDDKPTNRDVLRTVLGYNNHRILEAVDGVEGLAMTRAEHPDLVITDILMPRMDGYEMVQRLRNDSSIANTRVIFYTATYLKSEGMQLAQACGVSRLIVKPSEPQDILDTVQTALSEDAATPSSSSNEVFNREHLRLITNKLSQKVQELEDNNHRLIEEVAQRKRAEDTLRSSEARMTAVLDAALDAIITLDSDGKIVDLNSAAEATFGYYRQAMLGKPLAKFMVVPPPSDQDSHGLDRFIPVNQPALLGRRFESTAVTARGPQVPVEVTVTRIVTGGTPMYTAFLRDLTEQKAREELSRRSEELEKKNLLIQEASRLKSEFLANMSHELRTPLNAIIGFSQLMHDGKVGPVSVPHKEYLSDILTSGQHLLKLINEILDLAKVEAGKMEFRPEPIDVSRIVSEVRGTLLGLAAHKNIQLETDLDPSLFGIVTDLKCFMQVLYNYLSNAIKFTDEGGAVMLRLRAEPPDHFRIEVEDTGMGIPPEDIGKLFVEFQQLDNSRHKKHVGTGLGLALTKRLVEAQGGHVGVSSVGGKGSTFFAVLPRVTVGKVVRET